MLCFCSGVRDSGAQKRVFSSAASGIGVVADLDLDHLVDVGDVALGLGRALGNGWKQLLGVELHALSGGADEAITGTSRVPGDNGSRRPRCTRECHPRERRRSTRHEW